MASIKLLTPSILSSFRLLAALVFPFCRESIWPVLIVMAGISDALDGWLARKWRAVTWQGGLIDAIADKLFVLTVLIVFAAAGKIAPLWIPIVISRDLLVLVTAIYIAVRKFWSIFKHMPARASGKLATGGQFVLFLIVAAVPNMTGYALIFASLCSVLSAIDYGRLFINELQARNHYHD